MNEPSNPTPPEDSISKDPATQPSKDPMSTVPKTAPQTKGGVDSSEPDRGVTDLKAQGLAGVGRSDDRLNDEGLGQRLAEEASAEEASGEEVLGEEVLGEEVLDEVALDEVGSNEVATSNEIATRVAVANHAGEQSVHRTSQRRLVERLSGWRLIAFFISAALNLGLLAGLVVLPLFVDSTRLFIITAFVLASHCVVLIAVAGFRFPISAKIALGSAHATGCVWALASVDALPWVKLGKLEVSTLYLIPMLTLMLTIGGVVVARLTGFHRSKHFSVSDVLLLVTAFAILFPLILQFVPSIYFTDGISLESLRFAFAVAAFSGMTGLVVSNVYLNFIPTGQQGLSPLMLLIGWFLLAAMFDWNLCQFGLLVAAWMLVSLVPVCGTVHAIEGVSQVAK